MCRWEFRSRVAPLGERESALAMRSERETPKGHITNCSGILALSRTLWRTEASWIICVIDEIWLTIFCVFTKHALSVFQYNRQLSLFHNVHIAASLCASWVWRKCISRVQTLPAVALCWRELLCSIIGESGSQQRSSGAPFPCYRAQTHLPLAPPISPLPPPLGMIISPSLHRTIIFQVRSYPSLLSFFMACFCLCEALHICTVPVQYVKEVNVCSVQSVISIYLFSLLVIYWFFRCLRKRQALAMYLNKHDCCVCTRLQGFLLTRETKLYIWGRLVVFRAMTVKNLLGILGYEPC